MLRMFWNNRLFDNVEIIERELKLKQKGGD